MPKKKKEREETRTTERVPPSGPREKKPRQTRYDPDNYPALAAQLKQDGKTNEEIAAEFGVSKRTLVTWIQRYDELRNAIKMGRRAMCAKVRKSMYDSCFEHTVEETRIIRERDPETDEMRIVRIEQFRRVVPPNTLAQQILLYNCDPEHFRRNPSVPAETGKDPLAALLEGIKDRQKEQAAAKEKSVDDGTNPRNTDLDRPNPLPETN